MIFNRVDVCRNEATRTPDPYVPNVVRYQLRYIPKALSLEKSGAKVEKSFDSGKYLAKIFWDANLLQNSVWGMRESCLWGFWALLLAHFSLPSGV